MLLRVFFCYFMKWFVPHVVLTANVIYLNVLCFGITMKVSYCLNGLSRLHMLQNLTSLFHQHHLVLYSTHNSLATKM